MHASCARGGGGGCAAAADAADDAAADAAVDAVDAADAAARGSAADIPTRGRPSALLQLCSHWTRLALFALAGLALAPHCRTPSASLALKRPG